MSLLKLALPGQPVQEDIVHKKNDDFVYQIKGYARDGTPYDFTGHTFLIQIKENATDEEAIVEITDASITIEADADGTAAAVSNLVSILHTDDDFDIPARDYVYDIEMTNSEGTVQTIQEGVFTVTQDVTRPIV